MTSATAQQDLVTESDSRWTSRKLLAALQTHYGGEEYREWALFAEVPLTFGGYVARRLDALAVGGWRSNAYTIAAFEFKVSRSDWMHELKHPDKRQLAEEVSNECWFVTAPGVVKEGEVPESWGHMLVTASGDVKRQKVARRRDGISIEPWFMAAVCRAAQRDHGRPMTRDDRLLWRVQGRDMTADQFAAHACEVAGVQAGMIADEAKREERERINGSSWDDGGMSRGDLLTIRNALWQCVGDDRHLPHDAHYLANAILDRSEELALARDLIRGRVKAIEYAQRLSALARSMSELCGGSAGALADLDVEKVPTYLEQLRLERDAEESRERIMDIDCGVTP